MSKCGGYRIALLTSYRRALFLTINRYAFHWIYVLCNAGFFTSMACYFSLVTIMFTMQVIVKLCNLHNRTDETVVIKDCEVIKDCNIVLEP